MIPNSPEVASLVLDIPDTCWMRGEFTHIQQVTGEWAIRVVSGDTIQVRFERLALERFVHLAVDLLAVPLRDDDPDYEAPAITSPVAP